MKEVAIRQKRSGRRIIKTVGVFTLGAALGSVIALLFAPASGQVTRRRIGQRIKGLRRTAVRQIGQTQKLLVKQAAHLREAAGEKLTNAREWVASQVPNGHSTGHSTRRYARRRA